MLREQMKGGKPMYGYLMLWAGVMIVTALIELASVQLVSIWFSAAALITFVVTMFDIPLWAQLIIFVAASLILLIATRPLVKKFLHQKAVATNADQNLGQVGVVVQTIDNLLGEGRVAVGGLDWSARSADGSVIEKGCEVVVQKIEGVKVIVRPKEENPCPEAQSSDPAL